MSVESERHEEACVLRLRVRLGGIKRTVERDPGGVHLLACHQVYVVTIYGEYAQLFSSTFHTVHSSRIHPLPPPCAHKLYF